MNGADELRAEHVGEIGRHGGEAAAIHRQDDAEAEHEEELRAHCREGRRQCIERDAEEEERVIGVLAADIVRQRRPEETAADVEQRQQAGEARRDAGDQSSSDPAESAPKVRSGNADQLAGEDLLQHRRGHADHADAGRDVQRQHPPDQPELRRLVRVVEMNVVLRDHRLGFARRRPAVGPPAVRNDAIGEGADHHEDEVDHAHDGEGLPHADIGRGLEVVDQQIGQRRADHGAAAEAHDRHAGRHAAAVREPFDQRRDRRDVAEAKADAADHAGTEPHDPELMDVNAEGADRRDRRPSTTPQRRRPCAGRRVRASRPRSRLKHRARRRTACTSSPCSRLSSRRWW